MTLCIPSGNDVANWQHKLSALKGLVVQVVVVSKNNPPLVPLEHASNQEELFNVHGYTTMSKMKPCGLDKVFGSSAIIEVNIIEPRVFCWKFGGLVFHQHLKTYFHIHCCVATFHSVLVGFMTSIFYRCVSSILWLFQ
jgi:hypothetical protein